MSVHRPVAPQEWFTAAELADLKLPGLPGTRMGLHRLAGREGWGSAQGAHGALSRPRKGRGGGLEYHLSLLPETAKAHLLESRPKQVATAPVESRESVWARYDRLPQSTKHEAVRRLQVIQRVEQLQRAGMRRGRACEEALASATREAKAAGLDAPFSLSTLYEWFRRISGVRVDDRLAYLAPDYTGRVARADVPREAWDLYAGYYLTKSRPTHAATYRYLERVAAGKDWTLPSAKTLARRLESEVPYPVKVLYREGEAALAHTFPHLRRDKSSIAPMQIGNLDGHEWDNFVLWPDGTKGRPLSVAVQDVASGMFTSIRFDKSLHANLVRLALADTFRDHGLFEIMIMDNGRENTAAMIAGGQDTLWRKAQPEDPWGVLKVLGIEAVFAKPNWGQTKPIERGFRNFAHEIAKHPAFEGAYTGHNVLSKPDSYDERALPIAEFEAIVRCEIAHYNLQRGRTGIGMNGRSFAEVMAEGVARNPPRRATAEQLRQCLLASKPVSLHRLTHEVEVHGHRYWSEALSACGQKRVMVRFDPEDLSAPVHVYSLDGKYLAQASCVAEGSFNNINDGRDQARRLREYNKLTKKRGELAIRAAPDQMAAALAAAPGPDPLPTPDPKVVRAAFGAPRTPEQAGPSFSDSWERQVLAATRGGG